jgi:glucose uptake protein
LRVAKLNDLTQLHTQGRLARSRIDAMFVVHSYPLAVIFCVVTMLGWGSWANAKKLARPDWRFELFYWDYTLGVLLFTLILGLTMGSCGTESRPFLADLAQASSASIISALVGGAIFNLANILLVAAIEIAGMVSMQFKAGTSPPAAGEAS